MSKLSSADVDDLLNEDEDDFGFKGGFVKKKKIEHVATKDTGKKRGHYHVKVKEEIVD